MRYFSMFSGIGGFEYGIEKANKGFQGGRRKVAHTSDDKSMLRGWDERRWGDSQSPACVGFSEIDKYAIQIYQKHFKGHKNYGDARRIVPEEIPDFDLLCGGFPCQAFSIAGKRGGFEDTRGTLFHEIARIASVKRPTFLLLENVKGLLSHDNGNTFGTILTTFSELGYFLEWQVLNSKDFGVPQNRERVFIVGHLAGECRGQVFPLGEINEKTCQELTSGMSQGYRVYDVDGCSTTIASGAGGVGAKTGLYAITRTRSDMDYSESSFAPAIRRLTPTESERLQGFPDGWTAEGINGPISDSQRYKCLGNAVTTNVIQAIMEKLMLVGVL